MSFDSMSNHPISRFGTGTVAREPVREGFRSPVPMRGKEEPALDLWIDQFWRCIHVFARVYAPGEDKSVRESYNCFFQSMAGILPSASMRAVMRDFMSMTRTVQKTLLESKSVASFFTVHRDVGAELVERPGGFFTWSLEDGDRLFAWTYLLHAYFNLLAGVPVESFNVLRSQYHPTGISKETWANPLWFMLHSCAYYARPEEHCGMCFKAFMSCLRYTLPCPKCRAHLGQNLGSFDIDEYLRKPEGLFEYTVDLHNRVNQSLGKPVVSHDEARRIYDPYGQPLVQQNMSVARFIA